MTNLLSSTMKRRCFHATLLAVLASGFVACGGSDDAGPARGVDANGTSSFNAGNLAAQLSTYPLAALSPAEADSLAFMREEEQLAHDVYAASATLLGYAGLRQHLGQRSSPLGRGQGPARPLPAGRPAGGLGQWDIQITCIPDAVRHLGGDEPHP